MNWNNNDTKYIIKKIIIYILICFAMFIIGTLKTHAASISDFNDIQRFSWGGFINAREFASSGDDNYFIDYDIDKTSVSRPNNYSHFIFTHNFSISKIGLTVYSSNLRQSTNDAFFYFSYRWAVIDNNDNVIYCDSNDSISVCALLSDSQYIKKIRFTSMFKLTSGSIDGLSSTNNVIITFTVNSSYYFGNTNIASIDSQVSNINDSINNSDVSGASSDADNLTNNDAFNDSSGLESVIQLPFNMVSQLSNTCQPIEITIPFLNYSGTIPCMSSIYTEHFNSLYNLIKVVINGFLIYRILLKVYELVHSARQPDEDKLEVIDL